MIKLMCSVAPSPIINLKKNHSIALLHDNDGDFDIVDTRKFSLPQAKPKNLTTAPATQNLDISSAYNDDMPDGVTGFYNEDYNIIYVDGIIRKKIRKEMLELQSLKYQYQRLESTISQPQTFLIRTKTLETMEKMANEIKQRESGEKLQIYEGRVQNLLNEYKKYNGKVKTVTFDLSENDQVVLDDEVRHRLSLIDQFLDIASEYIPINVIRLNYCPSDICLGCGLSLSKVVPNESGTVRCPNPECLTERNVVIKTKLAKDSSRINTNNNTEDESIDNFLRAFTRYQGLQSDRPDESLYLALDEYFARYGRPSGSEIRSLPLNERGRRGDTTHKMLWNALSSIGRSGYYEDANLIGNIYWGWTLPDVMKYRETIIQHYNKTQKVFHQIPPEERGRTSSLGTQYRLWRHLQLVGHDCSIDEFRIAEHSDSIRTHNKLWKMMCDGCNDPTIYYIP